MFDVVQLEKISISRKDRKEKYRSDGSATRCRNIEDLARDEEQMLKFQQTISRLSDSDVNAKFERMLVSTIVFKLCNVWYDTGVSNVFLDGYFTTVEIF